MPASKKTNRPDPRIVREGGYQPTIDPGPVPASMVRPATDKTADDKPAQPGHKKA